MVPRTKEHQMGYLGTTSSGRLCVASGFLVYFFLCRAEIPRREGYGNKAKKNRLG